MTSALFAIGALFGLLVACVGCLWLACCVIEAAERGIFRDLHRNEEGEE